MRVTTWVCPCTHAQRCASSMHARPTLFSQSLMHPSQMSRPASLLRASTPRPLSSEPRRSTQHAPRSPSRRKGWPPSTLRSFHTLPRMGARGAMPVSRESGGWVWGCWYQMFFNVYAFILLSAMESGRGDDCYYLCLPPLSVPPRGVGAAAGSARGQPHTSCRLVTSGANRGATAASQASKRAI